MAKDDSAQVRFDGRVAAIVPRIRLAVMEMRPYEDQEVRDLLISISTDERSPALHGQLIDAIEEQYGTGLNGLSDGVLEILLRYCEAGANRSELEAGDAEDVKAGLWTPIAATLLGGILVALFGSNLPVDLAVIFGCGLAALAAWSLFMRSRAQRRKRSETEVVLGLRALAGAIERRRR